jgi:glycosyltransferase involved in cell wall biosynthesis
MDPSSISLCMIVRNEARALPCRLKAASQFASEIIVVDTGSTDGTPGIARGFGATVAAFDFSFADFSAARNFGLGLATGAWILALDADETIPPESVSIVRELGAAGANAGYYFERLNQSRVAPAVTADYVVRLFPNRAAFRFRGRVHETADDSILRAGGLLLRSGARILHDFAANPEARRLRNLRYIEILNEEIAADPGDSTRLDFLAAEYHQLGMYRTAARIMERIVRARPLDARAHLHAGMYHLLHTGERERAREDLLEALRLRPGYAEAQSFLELAGKPSRVAAA